MAKYSDIDNVQFRKDSVFQSRSNKYFIFFKGCWFFFHNGNFTSEVVRLLVFIFIKNWIKSVHLEGKRFSHNFIPHKFEQIILVTFPWKVPHYYEVYEESDAK